MDKDGHNLVRQTYIEELGTKYRTQAEIDEIKRIEENNRYLVLLYLKRRLSRRVTLQDINDMPQKEFIKVLNEARSHWAGIKRFCYSLCAISSICYLIFGFVFRNNETPGAIVLFLIFAFLIVSSFGVGITSPSDQDNCPRIRII